MADSGRSNKSEPSDDLVFERGLPSDHDAERLILGATLADPSLMPSLATLPIEAFSMEKHRRIHARLLEIHERGETADRMILANELRRHGQLESVDGYSYLVSLDEGLPALANAEGYIRIIREKHNLRQIIFQAQRMVTQAFHGEQTPTEILAAGAQQWNEIESNIGLEGDGGRTPEQIITGYPGGLSAFMDPTLRKKGISTGFTKLDEMTGGLHAGEVVVLAANTSQGKTALALNIAHHLAVVKKRRVLFFSLEMSADTLITRMMCSGGRVDAHKFRAGYLNANERERLVVAMHDITESNFVIVDRAGIMIQEFMKVVRKRKERDGLDFVACDYLQLFGSHMKGDNRNAEIAWMSRQIKMLAGECQIPILLLSQLSRAGSRRSDPRPMLSDLRDSGTIEQDADTVMFIWREELLKRDREDLRGLADLIIAKQRNGPVGTVPLRFLHQFTRFENRAEDIEDIDNQ